MLSLATRARHCVLSPVAHAPYRALSSWRQPLHALLGVELSASHADVRRAYLAHAMRVHPDKVAPNDYKRAHEQFAALQAAWDRYEHERPRNFRRRRKVGDDEDPTRQLYGVGCSWTDNEAERLERISVQEQAAHGLSFRPTLTPRADRIKE
ncbi:hypothetical protein KFE25_013057 [Diacronema lutheri]|uniref:J domain-containing protein n=1 Tax=Diacronema lutheri TaxID=2081491 RepID=A0A8J5X6H4_DIALT|nr:hypothetical protein KFE25_013057 [Diacronema lutheri]